MDKDLRKNVETTEIAVSGQEALTEVNMERVNSHLDSLRNMEIRDIDLFGSDIQNEINQKSLDILDHTNMTKAGSIRGSIEELQAVSKRQKKMIPLLGTPLKKLKYIQNNLSKVGTHIRDIEGALTEQKDKLDDYIQSMLIQTENLSKLITDLRDCEEALDIYVTELDESPVVTNELDIRKQSVASRYNIVSGTRVHAEQAQVEAFMIIKSQQEAKYQLQQVIQNVIPVLNIQAVNSIGIQANKETLEMLHKTRDIIGNLVEQNAKEVQTMAMDLQSNRTKSVIDPQKLENAQNILNETLKMIGEASEIEAQLNIDSARNLREKAEQNIVYNKKLQDALK